MFKQKKKLFVMSLLMKHKLIRLTNQYYGSIYHMKKILEIWESFNDRMNENLNFPFMYLTIKSIIDCNVWDFHVCIIDDDSFTKLIPSGILKFMVFR